MPVTLTDLAAALAAGHLTAEALVERCLARIDSGDGALNSFVHVDADGARAAARASDARRKTGKPLSALDGIPLSIKDNLLVSGMPATWGSRALKSFVPDHDELPVARLRAAGMIPIGKTNVPELTLEGYTSNALFGTTGNPFDPALTPGGSSGGAAASVAAGFVPAAIGTDGGGSIRRPACHTGLVGWKPSIGGIARGHGFPPILGDFETIGTLTRTVADVRLLADILSAPHADDRCAFAIGTAPAPQRARILFIPAFGASPVDAEIAGATRAVAEHLVAAGHSVEEGGVFFDLDVFARIWAVISRSGVAWLLDRGSADLGDADLEAEAGPSVRAMAAEGRAMSGADYFEATDRVNALRAQCDALLSSFDFILTPTAAALPWPAAEPYPDRIAGQPAGPRAHAIFTGWVNAAGLPAISLPAGFSRAGLPIGIQLVAGFRRDAALLAFAEALAL